MKKLILIGLILIITNTAHADATNPSSKSIELNTSTFTAITIDHSSIGRGIGVVTSDATAWVYSEDAAGTTEITIPAPGSLSFECRQDDKGVLFYAKASAGTPTLSVMVGVCNK